jgi:multisubunit Na+/H+ antiporter MnhC subunit
MSDMLPLAGWLTVILLGFAVCALAVSVLYMNRLIRIVSDRVRALELRQ